MAIYPYATLANDPLTQFDLHWLDDGASAGSQPPVFYRKLGETDWTEWQGSLVFQGMTGAESNVYYWCRIDELDQNTEYEAEIRANTGTVEVRFRTLRNRLHRNPLRVICAQDIHIRRNGRGTWDDVEKMDIITAQNPDFWILAGDWLVWADDASGSSAAQYKDWVTNFLTRLNNEGRLVPIFYTVGNHEVGNHTWNGETTSGLANNIQVNQFTRNFEKFGVNRGHYGQIAVGNIFNSIALDTHSEYPSVQGEWLDNNINKEARMAVAFYHNPMFVVGDRQTNDPILGIKCIREWMAAFWDAENVIAGFSGNIHLRKATRKLKVKSDSAGDTYPTKDGRHVGLADEGERYFLELGEGWADGRSIRPPQWFTDYVQSGGRNLPSEVVVEHYYLFLVSEHQTEVQDIWIGEQTDYFYLTGKRIKEDYVKSLMV